MKFLLRFAILAPSSHNTQPWKFHIGENFIDVRADFSRRLKEGDETGRMLYTALGCAMEHIKIAADHYGFGAVVSYNSDLGNSLAEQVARITFNKTAVALYPKNLFAAILRRASYRGPYQSKKIALPLINKIATLAEEDTRIFISTDKTTKSAVAQIVGEGMKQKMALAPFRRELARWLRTNITIRKDGMPGSGHFMPLFISLIAPFVLRFIDVSNVEQKRAVRRVENFQAFGIISTPRDNALAWTKTGEILERIWLTLSAADISMSVMVAAIETTEQRKKMQQVLNETALFPQTFFGLGYPVFSAPHSPRRNLQDVLI